jgi:hypothetical protein
VSVKAPWNLTIFQIPADTVPRPVIVVVPLISWISPVLAPKSVVLAEAIAELL